MKWTACFSFFICVLSAQNVQSQMVEISGTVIGDDEIENIHVINKTAKIFAVTNNQGKFKIIAKLHDTLVFSAVQYKLQAVSITLDVIKSKAILVRLEENVNELDQVVIGKVLSGNLEKDIIDFDVERPIDFYDVGISGYTGKLKTKTERRLFEATTGANGRKLKWYSPLTGYIPLNPIINGLSGRTKMLKYHLKLEEKDEFLHRIRTKFSKDFFSSHPLDDDLKMDFFYFCVDDVNFLNRCKDKTDLEVFVYLQEKYEQYIANLNEHKD